MDLSRLEPWALRHHGLVTLDHALAEGITRSAWYRALDRGTLEPVHVGVARMRGTERTLWQRIAAAVLAGGPGTLASHRSAGLLWEMPVEDPGVVHVITPRSSGRRTGRISLDGVVVHRPTDVADLAPSTRHGIACTNPLRTLCDLGADDTSVVVACVEHVIVSGLVRPSGLHALVERHAARGRTGIAALRSAVAQWPLGDKPADSVLEAAMARLVTAHALPPVEFHPRLLGYEVDFRFVDTPVLVECDSWEFHVTMRDRWQADRVRDADLSAAGFVTVRLTYEHITRRAAATASRLRAVLQRWAPESLAAA